ncbi:hypothetical protein CWO90_41475 [Bradyrhizobium sp. Leo121]|nr:hypothetical protein CWO90_41475 [Bradyrhizobium sp. Leo121]
MPAIKKAIDSFLKISEAKRHRRSSVHDVRQYLKSKMRTMRIGSFQLLDIAARRIFLRFRGTAY